jgi:hypothetical protein
VNLFRHAGLPKKDRGDRPEQKVVNWLLSNSRILKCTKERKKTARRLVSLRAVFFDLMVVELGIIIHGVDKLL